MKIRNINSASNEQNLAKNLRLASSELIQPLMMGCASKNSRLVQVSLQAVQRMVQHGMIEPVIFVFRVLIPHYVCLSEYVLGISFHFIILLMVFRSGIFALLSVPEVVHF